MIKFLNTFISDY